MVATLFRHGRTKERTRAVRRIWRGADSSSMIVGLAVLLVSCVCAVVVLPDTAGASPFVDDLMWISVGPGVDYATITMSSSNTQGDHRHGADLRGARAITQGATPREATTQEADLKQAVHVLRVERDNPYTSLAASLGRGQVEGTESVLGQALRLHRSDAPVSSASGRPGQPLQSLEASQPLQALQRLRSAQPPIRTVVGGVNADFFASAPVAGLPIGLHVQDGEIVVSPNERPVFAVRHDGQPVIGVPRMSGEVWREGTPMSTGVVGSANADFGGAESDELFVRAPIDDVNRPPNGLGVVLYTPRFGAETPPINGVAVTLRGIVTPIIGDQIYSGVVARRQVGLGGAAVRVAIPSDGVVLAARGPAEVFLEALDLGEWVQFQLQQVQPFDHIAHAVAGAPVLVRDGQMVALNGADSLVTGRHPRTAVGFNDTYIFLVTVDGRQAGYADGMTLPELADFMVALGVTEALNLDGGGSTTFVVRPPGEEQPVVMNRPSDGHERGVANALLVVSAAPPGRLARLHVLPSAPAVLVGASVPLEVRGQDQHNNPVTLEPSQVTWTVAGADGEMSRASVVETTDDGGAAAFTFVANQPGRASVFARVDDVETTVHIDVVDAVARIELWPDIGHLSAGATMKLEVGAFDADGRRVWVEPRQLTWFVDAVGLDDESGGKSRHHSGGGADAGTRAHVDAEGRITGLSAGEATVRARLGQAAGLMTVTVDRPPVLLSDFETPGEWFANAIRAQAALTLSGPPDPVHSGERAGKLEYDLSVAPGGTAAAYVQAHEPIPIPDRPRALGVWVYGDESGHWLRANYFDGEENRHVLDLTAVGGLDWTGWRFVQAELPADVVLPLSFERMYVVEMHRERQTRGVLYFDELVALYGQP